MPIGGKFATAIALTALFLFTGNLTAHADDTSGKYAAAYLTPPEVQKAVGVTPSGLYDRGCSSVLTYEQTLDYTSCFVAYPFSKTTKRAEPMSVTLKVDASTKAAKARFKVERGSRYLPSATLTPKKLNKGADTVAWALRQKPAVDSTVEVTRTVGEFLVKGVCTMGPNDKAGYACASNLVNATITRMKAKGLI